MAKRRKADGINNIVVVSDTHCGCRLGLCPPNIQLTQAKDEEAGTPVDDGGRYHLSKTQKYIWSLWEEFWHEWVPSVTHGEPFCVVHNGDLTDGIPHRATTPISHNLNDQAIIAEACMKPVVELCEGRYYQIRGTDAHVGKSSVEEERIGRALGAIKNEAGQSSHYELWKQCGDGLVHFSHHIGVTSSTHHELSALSSELSKMYTEAARWGTQPPQIIVRSHRHRYNDGGMSAMSPGSGIRSSHRAIVIVTPAWQGKTPFAWKVNRGGIPQFGGVLIRHNGEVLYHQAYVKAFTPQEIF